MSETTQLTADTKLLTPDDLIVQARIASKPRWTMSIKQHERRQLQVLSQIMK